MKPIKSDRLKRRVAQILDKSYYVRLHMFMILTATALTGLICSKLLVLLGMGSMAIRFGIATILSYLAFFLFIKLWLLYIGAGSIFRLREKANADSSPSLLDLNPTPGGLGTGSGGTQPFNGFADGASGGGGAGGGFDYTVCPDPGTVVGAASNSSVTEGVGSAAGDAAGCAFGDEDGLGIIAAILLAALVLSIIIAGGYLIWCAPSIMSEAVFQVLLATGLAGKIRKANGSGWEISILKSTWWIFLLVLLFSVGFGFAAQKCIPTAITVKDIINEFRWQGTPP